MTISTAFSIKLLHALLQFVWVILKKFWGSDVGKIFWEFYPVQQTQQQTLAVFVLIYNHVTVPNNVVQPCSLLL
jgi:hypothetical protein